MLHPVARLKMVNAVTEFDRKQSTKKGYSPYALAQYFQAIERIAEDMANGFCVLDAIERNFIGRLAEIVKKTIPSGILERN